MIQTTTWRPDTCGCEIVYQWDDTIPANEREHTVLSTDGCTDHLQQSGKANHATIFNTVSAENKKKNLVLGALIQHADLGVDVVQTDGSTARQFKVGNTPTWSINKTTRTLQIQLPNIGAVKKAAIIVAVKALYPDIDIS